MRWSVFIPQNVHGWDALKKTAQPFIRSEQGPRGTAYKYTLGQGPLYGVAVVVLASTTTTTTRVHIEAGPIKFCVKSFRLVFEWRKVAEKWSALSSFNMRNSLHVYENLCYSPFITDALYTITAILKMVKIYMRFSYQRRAGFLDSYFGRYRKKRRFPDD